MSGQISVTDLFARVIRPRLAAAGPVSVIGTLTAVRDPNKGWRSLEVATITGKGEAEAKLSVSLSPSVARVTKGLVVGAEVSVTGMLETHALFAPLRLQASKVIVYDQTNEAHAALLEHLRTIAKQGRQRANKQLRVPTLISHVAVVGPASGGAGQHDTAAVLANQQGLLVSHFRTAMMGTDAAAGIADAIRCAGEENQLVLLCRGGGAATDLAAFNTIVVVDAILGSPVPVITGIGHVTDSTAADSVAHTVTATPTAAAAFVNEARGQAAKTAERTELVRQQREAAQQKSAGQQSYDQGQAAKVSAQVTMKQAKVAVLVLLAVLALMVLYVLVGAF